MKDNKRILAALLAVMMAASSSAVVFADGLDTGEKNLSTPMVSLLGTTVTINGSDSDAAAQLQNAVQTENAQITINGTVQLTSTLQIAVNGVSITGGTIDGSNISGGHVINITSDNVALSNLVVLGGTNTSHNVQFYMASGTLTNVKSEVKATSGYHVALMVNGSTVTVSNFEGINPSSTLPFTVEVGQGGGVTDASSLSGSMTGDVVINVDMNDSTKATIDLDGVYLIKDKDVNDGLWSNKPAVTVTKEGKTVGYMSLEEAVNDATGGETITLKNNAEISKMLDIKASNVILDLGGNTLTASDNFGYSYDNDRHLVQVYQADGVIIKNGTIKTTDKNKNGVNVYQSENVTLNSVTIDHSSAWKGAPLIVNGSGVTVEGTLGLVTGEASWYGVNVANGQGVSGTPDLKFASGSKVNFVDNSGKNLVFVAAETGAQVSSDSEFVDVATDANGNIVVTPDSDGDSNSNSGSVVTPTPTDNNWRQNATGWWYQNPDGTYPANQWKYLETGKGYKAWYWFNGNGYITFGWQKVGNTWYYMNRSGEMQTGWVFVNNQWYYLNENGAMVTGWVYSGGRWYYMNNDGSMHFGWLSWAGYWYHLDSHGMMSTGWKQINGKWYYFYGENGRMAANTTTPDGYQVGADGAWVK